jgi:hypothetical protein
MIALRDAIGRASQRPWLWVAVLLLLATLLVFVALHGVEHAVEGGDLLLCITVASVAVVLLARDLVQVHRLKASVARDPPVAATRVVGVSAPGAHSLPLRL